MDRMNAWAWKAVSYTMWAPWSWGRTRGRRVAWEGRVALLAVAAAAIAVPAGSRAQPVAASAITVDSVPGQAVQVFRDAHGREITLRGFNVSGSARISRMTSAERESALRTAV